MVCGPYCTVVVSNYCSATTTTVRFTLLHFCTSTNPSEKGQAGRPSLEKSVAWARTSHPQSTSTSFSGPNGRGSLWVVVVVLAAGCPAGKGRGDPGTDELLGDEEGV